MTRYKEYFMKMISDNKELFDAFTSLHFEYSINPDEMQEKFNTEGEKVMEIVREYENRLCHNQENGMYNRYSANLAEKFQNEIRSHFPLIDHIGLKVESVQVAKPQEFFNLKKINLS